MKVLMLNGSAKTNGNTYRSLLEVGKQLEKEGIEYDGQYAIDSNSDIEIQIAEKDPRVVQESNRVFLSWMSADIHEDITEDFSDGHAEITVDDDDHNKMKFTVTGTVDKYKIVLSYRDRSVEFFSE